MDSGCTADPGVVGDVGPVDRDRLARGVDGDAAAHRELSKCLVAGDIDIIQVQATPVDQNPAATPARYLWGLGHTVGPSPGDSQRGESQLTRVGGTGCLRVEDPVHSIAVDARLASSGSDNAHRSRARVDIEIATPVVVLLRRPGEAELALGHLDHILLRCASRWAVDGLPADPLRRVGVARIDRVTERAALIDSHK